jgi:hypothetical protein
MQHRDRSRPFGVNGLWRPTPTTIEERYRSGQAQLLVLVVQQLGHDFDAFRAVLTRERCDIDGCWRPAARISADTLPPRSQAGPKAGRRYCFVVASSGVWRGAGLGHVQRLPPVRAARNCFFGADAGRLGLDDASAAVSRRDGGDPAPQGIRWAVSESILAALGSGNAADRRCVRRIDAHQALTQRDRAGARAEASVPCNGCTACCHCPRVEVDPARQRAEDLLHLDLISDPGYCYCLPTAG